MQGCCIPNACSYMNSKLPATLPIYRRFLCSYCPAGAACQHKHFTLRMVREGKPQAASLAGAARQRMGGEAVPEKEGCKGEGPWCSEKEVLLGGEQAVWARSLAAEGSWGWAADRSNIINAQQPRSRQPACCRSVMAVLIDSVDAAQSRREAAGTAKSKQSQGASLAAKAAAVASAALVGGAGLGSE